MEEFGKYILSVIVAAMILGILTSITGKNGGNGTLLRLIGGLFLSFTIISPLVKMDFSGITDFLEQYHVDALAASVSGEELARDEYRTIIKSRTEAYILDKAQSLGVKLSVEVKLSKNEVPVPAEAVLRGRVSPWEKSQLQQILEDDLGIAKENQLWIGQP